MTASLDIRDQRALDAIAGGPLSSRELSMRLLREDWERWAEQEGFEIAWDTDDEPVGARLLALAEAREAGLYCGMRWEIYRRLVRLEKRGLVERIQVPGHRPMLWRLP